MKLCWTLFCLALVYTATAFPQYDDNGNGNGDDSGNGDNSGGGDCSSTPESEGPTALKSAEPQIKGKLCSGLTKDDCLFIDDADKECPCVCGVKKTGPDDPAPLANALNPAAKGDCFNGDALVLTEQYGKVTMSELASEYRDARVLARNAAGQQEFSPIVYWIHAEQASTMFVNLLTASGHRLSLTRNHLIYKTECNGEVGLPLLAYKLRAGDCVLVNDQGRFVERQVTQVDLARRQGKYAPLTAAGSIVVDDVLASCYTNYENESVQKYVYNIFMTVQKLMSTVLPESLMRMVFNVQSDSTVTVSQIFFKAIDLSNVMVF